MSIGKFNENYVLTGVRVHKNLEIKSSMPLLADPDSIVEELKHIQLHCYVWLNDLKATLPLLIIEDYR